ncbi:MAG: HAD-IIB family hydrolase [Pseudomonadota bacterium]
MADRLLLCSDLDRTLLPNGRWPESPQARPRLRAFAARPETAIAYVSGRHEALLHAAIAEYDLPEPDFAIGDVGTTIYRIANGRWTPWQAWHDHIAPDWAGRDRDAIAAALADLPELTPQEPEKQNTFKCSWYAPTDTDRDALLARVRERLDPMGIRASLIWSIDEAADTGLLDILPERATKRHAVEFLVDQLGFARESTVFAGDSGNDLPVFDSGLEAVLVRNAADDVCAEARERVTTTGHPERLYVAEGDFLGMNGYYAAGVLEGVANFHPRAAEWMALPGE